MTKRKIAVFCSSSRSLSEEYYNVAAQLGQLIGERNHSLIYGGTDVGMMKSVAEATKLSGGHVTGVMPKVIAQMGIVKPDCDVFHETADMSQRKSLMAALSDSFVAMPGGFGTLEEFSEVLTAKHLGSHQKAIVLLNANGFYDSLLDWFESLYVKKFAGASYKSSFYVAGSAQETIEYLETYTPETAIGKY